MSIDAYEQEKRELQYTKKVYDLYLPCGLLIAGVFFTQLHFCTKYFEAIYVEIY